MGIYRDAAYRLSPGFWADEVLKPALGIDLIAGSARSSPRRAALAS